MVIDLGNILGSSDKEALDRLKFYNSAMVLSRPLNIKKSINGIDVEYYVNQYGEYVCSIIYGEKDTLLVNNTVWDYVVMLPRMEESLSIVVASPRPVTVPRGSIICCGTGLINFDGVYLERNKVIFRPCGEFCGIFSSMAEDIDVVYSDKNMTEVQGAIFNNNEVIPLREISHIGCSKSAIRNCNARILFTDESKSFIPLVRSFNIPRNIMEIFIEIEDESITLGYIGKDLRRSVVKRSRNIYKLPQF